jgi:hypothetical protein
MRIARVSGVVRRAALKGFDERPMPFDGGVGAHQNPAHASKEIAARNASPSDTASRSHDRTTNGESSRESKTYADK